MTTQTLTIQDLSVLRTAVELAAQRGAFRAEEMRQVGECYERLVTFLNTMNQQNQPAATPSEPAPPVPQEDVATDPKPSEITGGEFQ